MSTKTTDRISQSEEYVGEFRRSKDPDGEFLLNESATSRRIPFLPSRRTGQKRGSGYEREYPPDEVGAELGSNARVWHVYLDEADEYDAELVDGFRDTTDVLLVFAGLFSAVVSSFLSQSSQALQPDYAQITASLMTELINIQRAVASGKDPADIPMSPLSFSNDNTTTEADRRVNALWFTSLTLSLIAALIAVLAKQWLLYYMSALSGTPRQRVLVRHFRFMGLERWGVSGIIKVLPVLLHIALFLFLAGLVVSVWGQDHGIAIIMLDLTILACAFYWCTSFLAAFIPDCSYKSPISDLVSYTWQIIKWLRRLRVTSNPAYYPHRPFKVFGHQYYINLPDPKAMRSTRTIERQASEAQIDNVLLAALVWLSSASSNPQSKHVVNISFAGLPFGFNKPIPLASQIEITTEYRTQDPGVPDKETLFRSLAFVRRPAYFLEDHRPPPSLLVRALQASGELGVTQRQHLSILAFLISKQVQLPPLLWMRLFERRDPTSSSLDIPTYFPVIFLLFDILRQQQWHSERKPTTGMNWSLPPQSNLLNLCEQEPQMKYIILGFLCRLLGVPNAPSTKDMNIALNPQPFLQVIRVALNMLKHNDIVVKRKESAMEYVALADKALLSLPFPRWCDPDFVEVLHHCVELQNILAMRHSFPITTPSYCRIPLRPTSLGLVMLYCLDILQHPWRREKEPEEVDFLGDIHSPWSLLGTLFRRQDPDILRVFLESDGLSLLRRCRPIAFDAYPVKQLNAMREYVFSLKLDDSFRRQHLDSIANPDHLVWLMWLPCCLYHSDGKIFEMIHMLHTLLPDSQSWTAAADILVDEFEREAGLHGPLVYTSSYWAGIAQSVLEVVNLVGLGERYAVCAYTSPAVNLPDEGRVERVRVDGELPNDLVYGPFAVRFLRRHTNSQRPTVNIVPPVRTGKVQRLRKAVRKGLSNEPNDIELGTTWLAKGFKPSPT